MGGEGHMLDMIRRLSEGREASRLRRERANDKLKHLNRTNEPYPLPNTCLLYTSPSPRDTR